MIVSRIVYAFGAFLRINIIFTVSRLTLRFRKVKVHPLDGEESLNHK